MKKTKRITKNLRLPPELNRKLADAADAMGHSLNAEITMRLQASFDLPQRAAAWEADQREKFNNAADSWTDMIEELKERFNALQKEFYDQRIRLAAVEAQKIKQPARKPRRSPAKVVPCQTIAAPNMRLEA